MEKHLSSNDIRTACLETFKLPDDFSSRLQELEISVHEGTMTLPLLKELFELYSTASSHYEVQGLMDEFNFYIQKMQLLLKNEKIQPLLARRKSQKIVQKFSLNMEEKKEKIEKIKAKIKENKKDVNSKQITSNLIEELNKGEKMIKVETMMHEDINHQEENFKKRLEEKRMIRGNSQPHLKLKAKLGEDKIKNKENALNLNSDKSEQIQLDKDLKKKSIKKSSNTPTKRKSILTANVFGDAKINTNFVDGIKKQKFKKDLEIDLTAEKIPNESNNLVVNEDNINEIFDMDYEERIESSLLKVWDSAQIQTREELEKIEDEMANFLDDLADEKFKKTVEITNKYEGELKDLQDDLDLNDETNVNTIIYNELLGDREKEMSNTYIELNEKKKKGLQDLKNKSASVKNSFDKMKEISKVKSDISQGIKNKIIKSLTPKEGLNKKFDFSNVNYSANNQATSKNNPSKIDFNYTNPKIETLKEASELTDSSNSESDDEVIDNMTLNKNLIKKSSGDNRNKNSKQTSSERRVSRGMIGDVNFRKESSNKISNEI